MNALVRRPPGVVLHAAIALCTTAMLVISAPLASAEPQLRRANTHGAISISADGAFGKSWNYPDKTSAFKRARKHCKQESAYPGTCIDAVWVRNGCAAVAVHYKKGFVTEYGWGVAKSRKKAMREAHDTCTQHFGKCKRLTAVCSPRP